MTTPATLTNMRKATRRTKKKDEICEYTSQDGYCCTSLRTGVTTCDSHSMHAPDVYERIRRDWTVVSGAEQSPYADYGLAQVAWNMDMMNFDRQLRQWSDYADGARPSPSAATPPALTAASAGAGAPAGKHVIFSVSGTGVTPVPTSLSAGVGSATPGSGSAGVGATPPPPGVGPTPSGPGSSGAPSPHGAGATPPPPGGLTPSGPAGPITILDAWKTPRADKTTPKSWKTYTPFDPLIFLTDDPSQDEDYLSKNVDKFFPGPPVVARPENMVVKIGADHIMYRGGEQSVYNASAGPWTMAQYADYVVNSYEDKTLFAKLVIVNGKGAADPSHHNDVRYLQTDPANRDALFQVASNYNSLEQMNYGDTPGLVRGYISDRTQGPAAVLCTLAATLWRRHAWAKQTGKDEPTDAAKYRGYPGILIKDKVMNGTEEVYHGLDVTIGGWLDTEHFVPDISSVTKWVRPDQKRIKKMAEISTGFSGLCVKNCDSFARENADETFTILGMPISINQMLTSVIDMRNPPPNNLVQMPTSMDVKTLIESCVFAAYCNTLVYAVTNNIKKVYLTLVGGGEFGIPELTIIECIVRAMRLMVYISKVVRTSIFYESMEIRLILWDGTEQDISGKSRLKVVQSEIESMYPATHGQFLTIEN